MEANACHAWQASTRRSKGVPTVSNARLESTGTRVQQPRASIVLLASIQAKLVRSRLHAFLVPRESTQTFLGPRLWKIAPHAVQGHTRPWQAVTPRMGAYFAIPALMQPATECVIALCVQLEHTAAQMAREAQVSGL